MVRLLVLAVMGIAPLLWAEPEKSWRQTAVDAVMAGDYDRAITYYQKWVEADPGDAVSLYNLACCYALRQRSDKAFAALEQAAAAGWSDSSHAAADTDLAPLHENSGFDKLLSRMAENARMRGGGYTYHTCKQQRVGRYAVVLPSEYDPGQRYPLIVLLHGYGQTAQQFAAVIPYINTHDYIYIIPEGSYPALDVDGEGYSHLRELDDYREDPNTAPMAAQWVMDAAEDAMKRYPAADGRVWLVGFSQGAALAHATAASYPEHVAGYSAHGGYIIPLAISEEQLARERQQGVRVLVTHGREDPAVSIDEGRYAVNMLRQAGLDVTFQEMNVPHQFLPEVGMAVDEWLKKTMNDKR